MYRMKLILEKEHIKKVITLQFIVMSLLGVLMLTKTVADSYKIREVIEYKDFQVAESNSQLKNTKYLMTACKEYVAYTRENNLDLYWKDRDTNDFYK